jgi:hypothetical protein
MIDSMIDQAMEDAMIDAMVDQAMEDAMVDAMVDQAMEDAMIENVNGFYSGSMPDKTNDNWTAVYSDFTTKSSEDINSLSRDNFLCFIHKKFQRTSKTGKTSYFSYHIVDENLKNTQLKIGDYICKFAEGEHWVSWEYENTIIKEHHYLTSSHLNNQDYRFQRTFFYPLDYTFASIVPLHKYNPFGFSFKKLNFLNKNSQSACGDKISRLKILNTKNTFLEISIYDFEKNIISLLKELNNSGSFIDFVLTLHLNYSVKYLDKINKDLQQKPDKFIKVSFTNIVDNISKLLEQNAKFLPHAIKTNPKSEINSLIKQYENLVIEITKQI